MVINVNCLLLLFWRRNICLAYLVLPSLADLGYFNTIAAGCFSHPRVEATPSDIFNTWNVNFTRETLPKMRILWPGGFLLGDPPEMCV